jgi:hypothetical protein
MIFLKVEGITTPSLLIRPLIGKNAPLALCYVSQQAIFDFVNGTWRREE